MGLGLVALRPVGKIDVNWRHLPDQLLTSVIYVVVLYRGSILSGLDLARRLLSRDMRLKPGIIAIPTLDPHNSQIIAALSAADVTLTPGELVIEFENNTILYVHCLDVEAMAQHANRAQMRRVRLLRRILGRSS
jgi:multisubunit Na+/H+ antiporter MnhE subunit